MLFKVILLVGFNDQCIVSGIFHEKNMEALFNASNDYSSSLVNSFASASLSNKLNDVLEVGIRREALTSAYQVSRATAKSSEKLWMPYFHAIKSEWSAEAKGRTHIIAMFCLCV